MFDIFNIYVIYNYRKMVNKKKLIVIVSILIILNILIMFIVFNVYSNNKTIISIDSSNYNFPKIITMNLSLQNNETVNSLVNSINPIFLVNKNVFYFISNRTLMNQKCNHKGCVGVNYINNNIYTSYIFFKNNKDYLKNVICHELLHTIIDRNEKYHKIVYLLGNKKVCFDY